MYGRAGHMCKAAALSKQQTSQVNFRAIEAQAGVGYAVGLLQ